MSYLEIKICFHDLTDFEKKLVTFPLFNSCLYISRNDPWIVKLCALGKVEIKLLIAYQIRAASLLQIRANVVKNWGSCFKLGQRLLQNMAAITNWNKMYYKLGRYYKLGQLSEIGA